MDNNMLTCKEVAMELSNETRWTVYEHLIMEVELAKPKHIY